MNLEVTGTQKILLVEESQGLSLHTDSKQIAVAIGGVSVEGPRGVQGEPGEPGARGPTGVISAEYPLVYLPGSGTGGIISADIGSSGDQLVVSSDFRLSDQRVPKDASVTNVKIGGLINQSKIANLVSDLLEINNALLTKSAIGHQHDTSDLISGTISLARLPIAGSGVIDSTKLVKANDSRLNNTRTPTDGSVTDSKIANTLSPEKITGTASVVGHKHDASDITTGKINISRLPTESINSSNVALANHTHNAFTTLVTFNNGLSANNQIISNVKTPNAADDAANKSYVDRVAVGLNVREAVKYTTTDNIILSGLTNQSGKIDAASLVPGERVLVKAQTDAKQNGIYVAASGSWSRSSDMNGSGPANWLSQVVGAYVFVTHGLNQANTSWFADVSNDGDESINVDPINFNQFSSLTINSGDGISILGSTISAQGSNTINVSGGISARLKNAGGITSSGDGLYLENITNSMIAIGGIDISTNKITGVLPLVNGGLGVSVTDDASKLTARQNIGLGNVNNTSDSNKTIFGDITGTLGASSIKQDVALSGNPTTTTQTADDTSTRIATTGFVIGQAATISDIPTASAATPLVGTSKKYARADHVHPIDDTREEKNKKGISNGYAGLDSNAKVPIGQLPTGVSNTSVAAGNHAHVFRTSHNFIIQGNIVTSSALEIPTFFAIHGWPSINDLQTTASTKLVAAHYTIASGIVSFKIYRKTPQPQYNITQVLAPIYDDPIALNNLSNSYTATSTPNKDTSLSVTINDLDQIGIWITGIDNSPKNLTVTIVLEHRLN